MTRTYYDFYCWFFCSAIIMIAYDVGYAPVGIIVGISVGIIAGTAISYTKLISIHSTCLRLFRGRAYSDDKIRELFDKNSPIDAEIVDILPKPNQNLIVYSGFTPFSSSGFDIDGWSNDLY